MNGRRQMSKKLVLAAAVGLVALVPMSAMAANKLIVNGTDGVTPEFVVTDSGYIGVGNSNPIAAIYATGNSTLSSQVISHYINPSDPVVPHTTPVTGGGGFIGFFNYPNPGVAPNYNLPLTGDRLGYFLFGSKMPDGSLRNGAGMSAYADGDWTSSSIPASFSFQTAPAGSTSRAERLRITSGGNIGINTPNPQATLDVNGSFRINPSNTLGQNGVAVTKPTCTDSIRGTFWFTQGSGQAKDTLELCVSNGTATGWVSVY